jgi:hypothetical protein
MHKGSLERVNNLVFPPKTFIAPYSVESSELHRQGYCHRLHVKIIGKFLDCYCYNYLGERR